MRRLACATLLGIAGLVVAVPAHAGGRGRQPVAPVRLSSVGVNLDGPYVRITVRATAALPLATATPTTEGPPRVFIDLPGVDPGQVPASVTGRAIIRRVRVALNSADPPVTRLVLDLAGDVTTALVPGGSELTIVVAPRDGAALPAPGTLAGAAVSAAAASAAAQATAPMPRPTSPAATTAQRPAAPPATATRAAAPAPPASRAASVQPPPAPRAAPTPASASAATSRPPAPAVPRPPTPPSAATPTPATPSSLAPAPAPAPVASAPATVATPAPSTFGTTTTTPATKASETPAAPAATRPARSSQFSGFGAARGARPTGRVSIYTSGAKASQAGGVDTSYGDVTTAVSYEFTDRDTDGAEYGVDMRHTAYSIDGRDPRVSVYAGYVGARLAGGAARARFGHLWLDDLGGLGALAGFQLEGRSSAIPTDGLGRWRGGVFAGLDPNVYKFGYSDGVRKVGAYAALEGTRGRRHVAGYVNIHNGSMTERSVLTVTNFVPAGPLFIYQAAEYDLAPTAGGQGHDGLSYFFTNARVNAGRKVELLGTMSRGRSVDTRGLSDDIQAGRPVSQQSIDGLRYESLGGRATVEVMPRTRVYAGYSRDKNNRDDMSTGRWLFGGFGGNVFGTGLDVTLSNSRTAQPSGSYHSTFVSVGREIGRRVYATGEFSTALSQVRFVRGDGLVIESKPQTKRFGGNASLNLWPSTSLFLSVERTLDGDYKELRAMTGLTFRLR